MKQEIAFIQDESSERNRMYFAGRIVENLDPVKVVMLLGADNVPRIFVEGNLYEAGELAQRLEKILWDSVFIEEA